MDEDGSGRAQHGTAGKHDEQLAWTDLAHQQGAGETAYHKQTHGNHVKILTLRLAEAKVFGIVDDEGPHHDLCTDIEYLCHDTEDVLLVAKQLTEGLL